MDDAGLPQAPFAATVIAAQTLLAFAPMALALNLTPGADMTLCLGMGLRGGAKAGMAAALGVGAACMIHTLAAGLGLAALIAAHPAACAAIRWGGALYLLVMAAQSLYAPAPALAARTAGRAESHWAAFRKGVIVNLLNPKVIVFMLALLPQFVDPARGAPLAQFLILGAIFNLGGTAANLAVGGFAGRVGGMLARNPAYGRRLQLISAALFAGLALKLMLSAP